MKRCPRCGSTHPNDLTFCPADGTPLDFVDEPKERSPDVPPPLAAALPVEPATAAPVASGGLSPIAVGLMMLAVVLAVAVGVWIGRGDAPTAPSETGVAEGGSSGASPEGSGASPPTGVAPSVPDGNAYLIYADSPGDGVLALRTEPSVRRGRSIAQIPHGVGAEVLDGNGPSDRIDGIDGRWIRVRSPMGTGWVFDGYTTTQDVGRGSGSVDEGRWATVRGPADGALNLRTNSNARSRRVTTMRRGESVYVPFCHSDVTVSTSGVPGRWCRVRLERGAATHIGWAFDAFLDGIGA